ncbi:RNA 2',3'-cyclic phosphodiesterase [Paenibacillus oenotherae]|uniref:RNA 2',3'-cyclic phosphodiesterase n=1 Tax=Paenibacillus oenotherae TaxID=1435645 RepID=A0ABS7D7Z6_9BACL|nr:RNA 2',3'-cyclic phosphodiesterase [Paenibacillus oenotherae]MBW7476062.1 RNA 2',3'-cyclic phosphodiesterase [Paenibacillus oenotherae]
MTDPSLRLFVAASLPSQLQQQLAAWSEKLRLELPFRKWVYPSDLHITLQFLGDTPSLQKAPIISALNGAASSAGAFELTLEGLRLFGRPSNPSILWAGVGGELRLLHDLQQRITAALAPLGFVPEERPYHPHITLARKYSGDIPFEPEQLDRYAVPAAEEGEPLRWIIEDIVLYSSTLRKSGPMYEAIAHVPLASSGSSAPRASSGSSAPRASSGSSAPRASSRPS